ncbi:MAG TPA: PASTA domain-containing protein [Thermoleophilia bacterium]|nr:PASTA domain-containing protein [Thermoleophilia bacterium]
MADRQFVGPYRVTGPAPAGRALEAYQAVDGEGHAVVVKLIAPVDRERFLAQMREIAAIDHPNIAKVLDWGVEGDLSYVVTGAIEGNDLASLTALGGPPAAAVVAELGAQAAAALAALHARGIVHGGVTPLTMVRTADGTLKLTDAGLATAAGPVDLSDADPPEAAYFVSPEEVLARPVTPLSDVYALGASLYTIAVGCVPFDGPNALVVAQKHVGAAPDPPRRFRPDLPAPLERTILKAMGKQPEQRPASAEELRRALARSATVLRDAPPAPASAPTERPRTPIWPWVIGLVIVAAVLAAIWVPGLFAGGSVSVPSVTGMTLDQARQTLADAGLEVGSVTPDASATTAPQGTVLSQDPTAGEKVDEGSAVALVIAGAGVVVVPDLKGLSRADAEAAITAAGLVLDSVLQDYSDEVPAGSVVEQSPAAGTTVPYGTAVVITVSTGPQSPTGSTASPVPGGTVVPSVVGMLQVDALAALEAAGLSATTTTMSSDTVDPGRVVSQTPAGGATVSPGANVALVVSTGPGATPAP